MYNKNLSALLPPSNLRFMSKYFILNSTSMKNGYLLYNTPPPPPTTPLVIFEEPVFVKINLKNPFFVQVNL